MDGNKKTFKMNEKERKKDNLEIIIYLVVFITSIIVCYNYFPNLFDVAVIGLIGVVLIYGKLKFDGLWVEIEDGFVRVYKRNKVKYEFYKDDLNFRIEQSQHYVKLFLWTSNQKVAINRLIIGERAFDELVSELVEITNKAKSVDFTKGKRNYNEKSEYVKYVDKNKTILGMLKSGFIKFVKILLVAYCIILLIVLGLIFGIGEGNYLIGCLCIVGIILIFAIVKTSINKARKKQISRYIEDNENIAFLHIEHKGFIKSKKIEIIELNGNRELELLVDTHAKPRKVFFINAGVYEALVAYVEDLIFVDGSTTTTKKASQIIKFEIETNKYYVLKYNVGTDEYSFSEEDIPRSLDEIVNRIEMKN